MTRRRDPTLPDQWHHMGIDGDALTLVVSVDGVRGTITFRDRDLEDLRRLVLAASGAPAAGPPPLDPIERGHQLQGPAVRVGPGVPDGPPLRGGEVEDRQAGVRGPGDPMGGDRVAGHVA